MSATDKKPLVVNPDHTPIPHPAEPFRSFEAFYPFYLGEHNNKWNKRMHLIGTSASLALNATGFYKRRWRYIIYAILQGYFWAWIGHFFFEKNKPATFKYPIWSLRGDFKMLFEVIRGRRRF